jgi:hypothetical protein
MMKQFVVSAKRRLFAGNQLHLAASPHNQAAKGC